ncbi:hypothetical protein [Agathobacter rectalis]|uniref:hypothetical protein n=1 Tax=Agathobacter rectalis TaxID=39491 RepID=UPI001314AE98|nr:hypothetical protein [Agathobacter rectalis]
MKNTGSHNGYLRFGSNTERRKSNGNQSKQYRIYIKESKGWVDVNKEFYTDYYREINAYRKRQQEHGRCVCTAKAIIRKSEISTSEILSIFLSQNRSKRFSHSITNSVIYSSGGISMKFKRK